MADRPALSEKIDVTPAMIEAGVLVLSEQSALASELLVAEIFRQMVSVPPPSLDKRQLAGSGVFQADRLLPCSR